MNSYRPLFLLLFSLLFLAFAPSAAFACPTIDGLPDYNCDGKLVIIFTGDSIASGRTGRGVNDPGGGYPGRLAEQLPHADIINDGVPGITSGTLLSIYKRVINTNQFPNSRAALGVADYIFIDVGRNDYIQKTSYKRTTTNIISLVKFLRNSAGPNPELAPLVSATTLIPTSRRGQNSFVARLNRRLLSANSSSFPVLVRFDGFSKNLLNHDKLHPTPSGYEQLEFILQSYLLTSITQFAEANRPDSDGDGVYDVAERLLFGTDPSIADSDGDGTSDGDEIFTYQTNPLDESSHP